MQMDTRSVTEPKAVADGPAHQQFHSYLFTTGNGARDIPVTGPSKAEARTQAEMEAGQQPVVLLSTDDPEFDQELQDFAL